MKKETLEKVLAMDGQRRENSRTMRYCAVERTRGGDVVVYHVAVRKNGVGERIAKVVGRARVGAEYMELRDIDYHGMAGWVVDWRDCDVFGSGKGRPVDGSEWFRVEYRFDGPATFKWVPFANPEDLRGTKYEWCHWDPEGAIGVLDYLKMYRRDPRVELLSKARLFKLVCPRGLSALGDKRFMRYVRDNMEELASKRCGVDAILYSFRHGTTIEETKRFFDWRRDLARGLDLLPRERARLDYERIYRLSGKWGVTTWEYARYLYEAKHAGLDLRCEGVLYPPVRDGRKSFMERFEKLEAENTRREEAQRRREARAERLKEKQYREQEDRLWRERIPEIKAFQRAVDRVREIRVGGYRCILAKSKDDLLREGRMMQNCVGSGRYGRGIVSGDCLILFFYKDGRPFVDCEIDRTKWVVRQCYAARNTAAPEDVYKLAERLAGVLKAEAKRRKAKRRRAA